MGGPVREHLSRSTGSENTAVVRSTDNHRLTEGERGTALQGREKRPQRLGSLKAHEVFRNGQVCWPR